MTSIVNDKEVANLIASAVRENVEQILSTPETLHFIEESFVAEATKAIAARAKAVDLSYLMTGAVEAYIKTSASDDLQSLTSEVVSTDAVKEFVRQAAYEFTESSIAELLGDPSWMAGVSNILKQSMIQRVLAEMSTIDVNQAIAKEVRKYLVERHEQRLPQTGLVDQASTTQLTLFDDQAVFENKLVARSLDTVAEADFGGSVRVGGDLILNGNLSIGDVARKGFVADVADEAVTIFCAEREVAIREAALKDAEATVSTAIRSLVTGNKIHHSITRSSLREVGPLDSLVTNGETTLAKTMTVADNRVGINTTNPDMALSVWDDDVSMSLGKLSARTGYIGTTRAQKLVIGTNRKGAIEIDESGSVTIRDLRLGSNKIGFASSTPNWSGAKGEWVWNSNPAVGQPFAWQCLGGTRWQGLKSA